MFEPNLSKPKSYREIADSYSRSKQASPFFESMSLPDYADYLAKNTESSAYDAARTRGIGGVVKSLSSGLDEMLKPVADVSGAAFGAVGEAISPDLEAPFRSAGEGLPRGVVNMLPMTVATALAPVTGGGSLAAALPLMGLAGAGAMAGAGSYEASGSPLQGLLSGASMMALPGFSKAGEALAAPITSGALQPVVKYLGGQAGAAVNMELAGDAASKLSGNGWFGNWQNPEAHIVEQLVGQLPFVAYDGVARMAKPHPLAVAAKEHLDTSVRAQKATEQSEADRTPVAKEPAPGGVSDPNKTLFGKAYEQVEMFPEMFPEVDFEGKPVEKKKGGEETDVKVNQEGETKSEGETDAVPERQEVRETQVVSPEQYELALENYAAPVTTAEEAQKKIETAAGILKKSKGTELTTKQIERRVKKLVAEGFSFDEAYKRVTHSISHEAVEGSHGERGSVKIEETPTEAADKLLPAIIGDDGYPIVGNKGEHHDDIIQRSKVGSKPERGFVDENGKFLSREEASSRVGETDPLHSETLNKLQSSADAVAPQEFNLLFTAEKVAREIFSRLGVAPEQLDSHITAFLELAAQLDDLSNVRLGRIIRNVSSGTMGLSAKEKPLIWLRRVFPKGNMSVAETEFAIRHTLSHELAHQFDRVVAAGKATPEAMRAHNAFMDFQSKSDNETNIQLQKEFVRELVPKRFRDNPLFNSMLDYAANKLTDAKTPDEVSVALAELRANIQSIMAMAHAEGRTTKWKEFLTAMPKPIADYMTAILDFSRSVLQGFDNWVTESKEGVASREVRQLVREHYDNYTKLARTTGEVNALVNQFLALQKINPDGFREVQLQAAVGDVKTSEWDLEGPDWAQQAQAELVKVVGEKPKSFAAKIGEWYEHTLMPLPQLGEMWGGKWRDIAGIVQAHETTISTKQNQLGALLRLDQDGVHSKEHSAVIDSIHKESMEGQGKELSGRIKAISNIHHWQQENASRFMPLDSKEFLAITEGLSPKDKKDVMLYHDKIMQQNVGHQQSSLATEDVVTTKLVQISLMKSHKNTMTHEDSVEYATQFKEIARLSKNPETAEKAAAMLMELSTKIDPSVFEANRSFAEKLNGFWDDLKGLYDNTPGFISLQRFGQFLPKFIKENGTVHTGPGFDTKAKAELYMARQQKAHPEWKPSLMDKAENPDIIQRPAKMSEALKQIQENRLEQLKVMLGENSEEYKQIAPLLDIASELHRSELGKSIVPTATGGETISRRKLSPGYEDIDTVRNQQQFINASLRVNARRLMKLDLFTRSLDPELRADPKRLATMHDAVTNFITPDIRSVAKVKQAAMTWFMGGRLSSALIMSHDTAMLLAPQLTAEGAGYVGGLRLIGSALKEITGFATSGKWSTLEYTDLMRNAELRHAVGAGSFSEFTGDKDLSAVNVARMVSDMKPLTKAELYMKPIARLGDASLFLMTKMGHFNNRMALLSGYDLARAKGMPHGAAMEEAFRINNLAAPHGGKAGRSVGFYSNSGSVRGAAQITTTLQSFVLSQLAMTARYIKHSYVPIEGVNQRAAQKAAVQMLLTQISAAGVLGLPGVGASMALLEKMFPNLQLHKNLKLGIQGIFGEDDETGNLVSDIAMRGLMNQTGLDFSSRLGLEGILGTNPTEGWSFDNFVGPVGSMFHSMVKGTAEVVSGDMAKGAQDMLPKAFKPLFGEYGQPLGTNSAGNKMFEPTEAEKFFQMIGFNPARGVAMRDAEAIKKRSDQVASREAKDFHMQVAKAVKEGDIQSAQQLLRDRKDLIPGYSPAADSREIAAIVEKQEFPEDLRRTGGGPKSAEHSAELERLYSTLAPPPSETQRLTRRKQIEGLLVPGMAGLSQTEMMKAQMVDQLMSMDRGLSRAEALQRVSTQLGLMHQKQSKLPGFPGIR